MHDAKSLLCLLEVSSKFVTLILHGILLLDWQSGIPYFFLAERYDRRVHHHQIQVWIEHCICFRMKASK